MKSSVSLAAVLAAAFMCVGSAAAQVPSHVIISAQITQTATGAGVLAPTLPGGAFNIGPYWWIADANGVFSYRCRDVTNPQPLETCQYPANDNPGWGFNFFAGLAVDSFGQAAKASDTTTYVASYSHSRGGQVSGIYRIDWLSPLPDPTTGTFPQADFALLAQQNLHGNEPTAIAIDLVNQTGYVGFLKNANLVRIDLTNGAPNAPAVSVGGIPGARAIYGLKFAGGKLYAASDLGLVVFGATSDITKCSGNANGCGTPQTVQAGAPVQCVEADGNNLYYVTLTGFLYRLNVLTGIRSQVDAGLLIEGGHSAACTVDGDHNLLVGEQPVAADINNTGQARVYLAADLAQLP